MPLVLYPDSTCDICFESYTTRSNVPHAVTCGHVFCEGCLDCLTQHDCPLCRKDFSPLDIRKIYVDTSLSRTSTGPIRLPAESVAAARQGDDESQHLLDDIARTVMGGRDGDEIRRLIDECRAYYNSRAEDQSNPIRVSCLLLCSLLEAQRKLGLQAERLRQAAATLDTTQIPGGGVGGPSSSRTYGLLSPPSLVELNVTDVNTHEIHFPQEEDDLAEDWNSHDTGLVEPTVPGDGGEARAADVGLFANYQFQTNNPYLLDSSPGAQYHTLYGSNLQQARESILGLEAVVQQDPANAAAWFELGVKQQESAHDAKAVRALERAVEIDPSHSPAWLALAVSHANQHDNTQVHDAIHEWALLHPKYEADMWGSMSLMDARRDFAGLIDVLVQMTSVSDVDVDLQIALGVLLYADEEHAEALDCFRSALKLRPNDWLLYDFIGMIMANNEQSANALAYYHQALELNPVYIRARSNLGASCFNLGRYEEAASHILDALVLQDNHGLPDGIGVDGLRGETSATFWGILKMCCWHLEWANLESMCDHRDLDGFRRVASEID